MPKVGEMDKQLRAHAALTEDQSSFTNTHFGGSQVPVTPVPGDQKSSS